VGDGRLAGRRGLPAFVPARFRSPIVRAASRWDISAGVLAAQLLTESNFNPYAVSPVGARGIAQSCPPRRRPTGSAIPSIRPARSLPRHA
jgi:hypothetical protein